MLLSNTKEVGDCFSMCFCIICETAIHLYFQINANKTCSYLFSYSFSHKGIDSGSNMGSKFPPLRESMGIRKRKLNKQVLFTTVHE